LNPAAVDHAGRSEDAGTAQRGHPATAGLVAVVSVAGAGSASFSSVAARRRDEPSCGADEGRLEGRAVGDQGGDGRGRH
jgi:hypothetical protein